MDPSGHPLQGFYKLIVGLAIDQPAIPDD